MHVGHMASHVSTCMSMDKFIQRERNQFIEEERNKKERKEKKKRMMRIKAQRRSMLLPRGNDPFQVLERINDNAYKLDLPNECGPA